MDSVMSGLKARHSTLQACATLTMIGLGHCIIAPTHRAFSPRARARATRICNSARRRGPRPVRFSRRSPR